MVCNRPNYATVLSRRILCGGRLAAAWFCLSSFVLVNSANAQLIKTAQLARPAASGDTAPVHSARQMPVLPSHPSTSSRTISSVRPTHRPVDQDTAYDAATLTIASQPDLTKFEPSSESRSTSRLNSSPRQELPASSDELGPTESFERPESVPDSETLLETAGMLDGRVVACRAACCWPLAKLLDQRASTLLSQSDRACEADQRSAELQASFLRRQAAWQRDVAAALALRAYYSWIANREQMKLNDAGLELQSEQASSQASLVERGVAIEDPTALERRRLELRDNQLQLTHNDRQLAQSILRLTCCSSDIRTYAVEVLEIKTRELPCDALINYALQHRQDYLAFVELCNCLDVQTARAVSQLLTPLVGGVGLGLLDLNLIEKICLAAHADDIVAQVGRELRIARELQRQRVEQAVCEKCQALSVAYARVEIAEQIVTTWETRVASLSRLDELGDARGGELAKTRGELLQARSTLVSRRLAAKLAEVDLAESVGRLAPRCCLGEPWLHIP